MKYAESEIYSADVQSKTYSIETDEGKYTESEMGIH